MKGTEKVIEQLNIILGNELVAISQYFLHARILKDKGYERLGEATFKESVDEMKHADEIVQRILFLEGVPNMEQLGRLNIGADVKEMLAADLDLEMRAIPDLRVAVELCERERDFVSRDLLQSILDDEEEHVDWLETQLSMIAEMGLQNYLQSAA